MRATRMLWQHRQPMIRFLGKRTAPPKVDHTPHVHPASPSDSLPDSFASYRSKAQQHGPLGGKNNDTSSAQSSSNNNPLTPPPSSAAGAQTSEPYGTIGGRSGKDLGSVQPKQGEFWDRNELPARFRRKGIAMAEIEAVESGGASTFA
ncbi:hypothetical protein MBLNU230_g5668t1 [Neophaeotheca triangularis]